MASKTLFNTLIGSIMPAATRINEAGGQAYEMTPRHALAQFTVTGCMNNTFYASADTQLAKVLALCNEVEPAFIAKVAIYARQHAHMKDLPALLCAVLSMRDAKLLEQIFNRVIDSPKMLRNFVQIMRSGVVGRRSLGSLPRRLIRKWIDSRSDAQLFAASVGNAPSLADIVKMVHPRPASKQREALLGYMIGRPIDEANLPQIVRSFEAYKASRKPTAMQVPDVPFQMLTSLQLDSRAWKQIARNAPWQMTRMNLNTFARQGVMEDSDLVGIIANRLRNREMIAKARVLPYQLMVAHAMCVEAVPQTVRMALHDAMEISLQNVPRIAGRVIVCPDVSGSMHYPVTGHRPGATSVVRCIDVAALVAAAMLRKNPDAVVLPFESDVVTGKGAKLDPRDSVMTNAGKLASLPSGGTNCSAPLRYLNKMPIKGDLVVFVSDNESWIDSPHYGQCGGNATATMKEWSQFKRSNPEAKMVCIDIQPYNTTQASDSKDIINVGGFSDQVFELIATAASGRWSAQQWVSRIESIELKGDE